MRSKYFRTTYITAFMIATLVAAWLGSGQLGEQRPPVAGSIAERNAAATAMQEEKTPTRVRVQTIHASSRERMINIRGTTRSKRSVLVRAQIGGTVINRPVERGDRVETGQLLCQISIDDREVALRESREALNRARIEYQGSTRLSRQGLQSETAIAQARDRLASAEANLKRSDLNLTRLRVTAPFDAIVEDVHLELGEYVTPGSSCATVVDLDPMLLVGRIPEKEVTRVKPGLIASATLSSGIGVVGPVMFVGKTADETTRTYALEIQIANRDHQIPSGISASINIPIESVKAQRISPALLSLDDAGSVGVKTIDGDNIVHFNLVDIISDDVDGIWVTGLPAVTRIITVGQELVVPGEEVEPTYDAMSLPALAAETDGHEKPS